MLKIDDLMLYQEYIIRDKVRVKEAEMTFDENKFEIKIYDLQNELSSLKQKHVKEIDQMTLKVERAYSDKERVIYELEQLQADYSVLTEPRKRADLLSDTIQNYKNISTLLEYSEMEKEKQIGAVNHLVGMYDIGLAKEWNKSNKKSAVVQTTDQQELQKIYMKTPW
jgi:hypothetical protein